MKKFLAILFAFALTFALACGGGGESGAYEEDEEEPGAETTENTTAAASGGQQTAAAAPADSATITGMIKLDGAAPALPNIPMGADPFCAEAHKTPVKAPDVVVAADGSLANVFVYIKDFKGNAPAPSGTALLDQMGCQYNPHVSGVQVGQTLQIRNSDPTLHNVHALGKINREFNVGQPVKDMVSKKTFDKPEVMIKFKCDVHGWMNSYIGVLPHPYFGTSQANGSFTISGVPPGTYTIEAWHEKFGAQTQQVTLGAKESKPISFTFKSS